MEGGIYFPDSSTFQTLLILFSTILLFFYPSFSASSASSLRPLRPFFKPEICIPFPSPPETRNS